MNDVEYELRMLRLGKYESMKVRTAEKKAERRAYIDKLKSMPCTDCGVKYPPYVMDFDHVRGEKVIKISDMMMTTMEKLKAEVAKCELVCSNCHRERTQKQRLDKMTQSVQY